MKDLRNIAIIAHVDHGKTTLVDAMLRQSGTYREKQEVAERVMDSNALEKERGITILAKCTSVKWNDTHVNIVDTPGHADFGGEVERILDMVDGVVLLVDASEGPMPQTKFVLTKALQQKLRPIVVINKIDKPDARPDEVLDEVFDLFVALDATEEQLDFPVLYAASRDGWAAKDLESPRENLNALFDVILSHVPQPSCDENAPFRFLVSLIESDQFLGRILTGKIYSGRIAPNTSIKVLDITGKIVEQGRISKLFGFKGVQRVPLEEAQAGDIISIAGLTKSTVSHTLGLPENTEPLATLPIDPPTLVMTFSINDSPYVGQDGDKVTSRVIRDRLLKEAEGNVSIRVTPTPDNEAFEVAGRGELQLGVLIENMRREGFELSISRPRVLYKTDESGQKLEPIEEVVIDVDEEYTGVISEKLGMRKGELQEMKPHGGGKTRLVFYVPTRGLIGYQSEFLSDTRGTGVMARLFHEYIPLKGDIAGRRNGVLISTETGKSVAYALWKLEDRGQLFIGSGEPIYQGMVVGENSRDNDLEVNPLKAKQLTNMRASGKDEAVALSPPRRLALEQAMSYINDDELIEVTPAYIRLRKRYLDPNERKRQGRAK